MRRLLITGNALSALFFCHSAYALSCYYDGKTSNITDEVTLDNIVYLSGTADGEVIWRSPTYSRNITCTTSITEDVYVYPFPKRKEQNLPTGVKMGVILNGTDLGVFDSSGDVNSDRVDTHWNISKGKETKPLTIQAYLVKDGDIDTTGVSDKLSLFQLDGEGGLNNQANSNYNFLISGWGNIGSVDCTSTLSNDSFTLSGFSTDQVFAGSATQPVSPPKVALNCTGSSAQVLSSLTSVSGDLSLAGTALSGNAGAFKTNKEDLGLILLYNQSGVSPGKKVSLTIPVTDGVGQLDVPLVAKPVLTQLDLNKPDWLFSEQSVTGIQSSVDFSFKPTLANTQ
ncbi:hypothetical protein QNN88_10255 [Citrobacter sp. ANG330]|uniref:hypothetical protein n=1 Tax=Citrobacter sp. ANG330 TaxID=3048142 RepID=UPI0039C1C6FA